MPPLDGAALACGIATLEHDDAPVAVGLAPLLQLQQFDLQQSLLLLVVVTLHPLVVRVVLPPGVDDFAAGLNQQHRVVIVVVTDGVATVVLCVQHAAKGIGLRVRRGDAPVNGRCRRYLAVRRGRSSASRVISLFIRVSALCELL